MRLIDEDETLLEELDRLRTPKDRFGKSYLGITVGPYIQGNPEQGYGGQTLQRIREIRKLLARSH